MITIKLSSAVLNHIRLKHPPPSSCSNEQEISRYFHRPHLPPSSAMLMEKRLILYNPKDGGKRMVTSLLEQHNRRIPDYYPTMYMDGFTPEEIMYAAKR